MNAQTKIELAGIDRLALLREPFAPNQISKLPKPFKKDAPKGKCGECGGFHGLPAMHLDYVGHAALTDRLLDVDPQWVWEPVAFGADGLPAVDRSGGMWIKLTVQGVTRLGYGSADGKSGGDAVKEIIGDALRNAAMRFGAALDLWHKGDLHADDDAAPADNPVARQQSAPATINADQLAKLQAEIDRTGTATEAICEGYKVPALAGLNAKQFAQAMDALRGRPNKTKPAGEFDDISDAVPY